MPKRSKFWRRSIRSWSIRPARSPKAARASPGFLRFRRSEEKDVLRVAATLERASEHPLAAAILAAANESNITIADLADFHYRPGKGVSGKVDGADAALGNRALFAELGIAFSGLENQATALEADGQTVIFVALKGNGGAHRRCRPGETHHARSDRTVAPSANSHRDAHRRQPSHGGSRRAQTRHR